MERPGLSNSEAQRLLHDDDAENEIPELKLVTDTVHFNKEFSCVAYFIEPGTKFHRFEITEATIPMQGLMVRYLVDEHDLSEQLAQGIITSWITELYTKNKYAGGI